MKTIVFQLLAILVLPSSIVFGQSSDSAKVKRSGFTTYDQLRKEQKDYGIDTLLYVDSTFNYQIRIPDWLSLKETGSPDVFGGTLPAVDGIENAIMVKGFSKKGFKSFEEFKDIYLTGNRFGEKTKYSNEHVWYGQNNLIEIDHGVKRKVFTIWRNLIYYNMFVLLETKSSYIWIQFGASPDTYDVNISKFDEFMAGFKILTL